MSHLPLMADLSAALRDLLEVFALDNDVRPVREAMQRRLDAQRRARVALDRADEVLHRSVTEPRHGAAV